MTKSAAWNRTKIVCASDPAQAAADSLRTVRLE